MKLVVILTTVDGDNFISAPASDTKAMKMYERVSDRVMTSKNDFILDVQLIPSFDKSDDCYTEICEK